MVDSKKDTIYIDVDDEITGIIDKVRSSKEKIVALVLPKRATVFHSIVNMKLLKRTAEDTKKRVVLITSETGVLPLAGAVGLHVAKTLQSQPAVPSAPTTAEKPVDVSESDASDAPLDKSAPVGALAGLPPNDEDETIEVDNAEDTTKAATTAKAAKKNKKLRIPNFDKFRVRLFLGAAALVLLIVGWIFAVMVLPKAKITIKTDSTDVNSNLTYTASPKAKELQKDTGIVPAETKTLNKTDATQVPATGQKDNGTKASGTVTITNCTSTPVTIPAGTGITSGGLTFIIQQAVSVSDGNFSSGGVCKTSGTHVGSSPVVAQANGDKYNLSARSYQINGVSGDVRAAGSDMSGGTSKIVKIVSQADVDGAKQKILDQNGPPAKDELIKQLTADGFIPMSDTFASANPVVTASPNVGAEGDQVSVNVTVNYTMLGVKKDSVKQLLEDDIKHHIDTAKQSILDNGLDKASFQVVDKPPSGDVKIAMQTTATAGVAQDKDAIKRAVAGKKKGDVKTILQDRPGVKDVTVNFSPFWVSRTPKKLSRITVVFEQSNNNANGNP